MVLCVLLCSLLILHFFAEVFPNDTGYHSSHLCSMDVTGEANILTSQTQESKKESKLTDKNMVTDTSVNQWINSV